MVGGGSRDPRSVRRGRSPTRASRTGPACASSRICRDRNAPRRWRLAAAQPTYNPLGRDLTFLSADDVAEVVKTVQPLLL